MKFVNVTPGGVLLDLDATDCTALADACDHANHDGLVTDRALVAALGALLRAASVCAAFDTLEDNRVPPAGMLADVRRVWGPRDTSREHHPVAPPPDGRA